MLWTDLCSKIADYKSKIWSKNKKNYNLILFHTNQQENLRADWNSMLSYPPGSTVYKTVPKYFEAIR